jgi:virginiamycin B lyase
VWYTAQRSGVRPSDPDGGWFAILPGGVRAPRRDHRPRRRRLDHGQWSQCHRQGRSGHRRGHDLPVAADRPNANRTRPNDPSGTLWFTGQSGVYGRLDPAAGAIDVWDDPEGRGPYGITVSADGSVWYASLGGSHIARVDPGTGAAAVVEPPTSNQGARRVWADSHGRIWVSEWDAGQVGLHDPATGAWREWRLPGDNPMAYAVFVDDDDDVWLTDFGGNTIVRFDPRTEAFNTIELPSPDAAVRQLHGRPGEVWGAESSVDKLVVVTDGG